MPCIEPDDYENPDWKAATKVHEWKNYIDDPVREIWDTITTAQKKALANQAQNIADAEEWE